MEGATMKRWALTGLAALAVASLATTGAARAEVVDKGAQGFRIKIVRQVAAPPAKVYAALGEIGRWWSDAHTYSGKAANMSMPLQADACFCESLPNGGGVRHGVVALVIPESTVRLDAALGPLQDEGVGGALTFQIKPADGGAALTVTYNVGGARDFVVSFASAVDQVLTEQADRLKAYAETGRP
jgi:uncharacterized protein YndB with AHSA1/START domain